MFFNEIIQRIATAGGIPFLVGGAVRDEILGRSSVDYDVEVHGLSFEQLREILENFGAVNLVGKAYGILKIMNAPERGDAIPSLNRIDWSLPRCDSAGRKPRVRIDPFLDITESLRRRDLTMNALARNLLTQEVIDPFGGLEDIQKGRLRTPDAHFFTEDPLRFFRVMQFIGRFEMQPDDELNRICAQMDLRGVARERIEEELRKLLLKSRIPSLGFRWIEKLGRLGELFPELAATQNVPQDPTWHPEGDVFEHSMQTLDAMVPVSDNHPHRLTLLYTALCHDFGKAVTTREEKGRIRSLGHEEAGVPIVYNFLKRITQQSDMIALVAILIRYHMAPGEFIKSQAGDAAYKRLALNLAPRANIGMLSLLAYADKRGRNGAGHEPLQEPVIDIDRFVQRAQEVGVYYAPEPPALTAQDLMPEIIPGPRLGELLRHAYKIQINKGIRDKSILKQRILR